MTLFSWAPGVVSYIPPPFFQQMPLFFLPIFRENTHKIEFFS